MPAFAHELQLNQGLRCEIVQGATDAKSKDLHYISGMEILTQADLAVVYARRRALPSRPDEDTSASTWIAAGR